MFPSDYCSSQGKHGYKDGSSLRTWHCPGDLQTCRSCQQIIEDLVRSMFQKAQACDIERKMCTSPYATLLLFRSLCFMWDVYYRIQPLVFRCFPVISVYADRSYNSLSRWVGAAINAQCINCTFTLTQWTNEPIKHNLIEQKHVEVYRPIFGPIDLLIWIYT